METEKTVKFNKLSRCGRFGLVLLLSWMPFFVAAEQFTGVVVGVSDGDTLTILDDDKLRHKIRLAGIDAPEKAQPFGQASKQSLSDLVFGKLVTVDSGKTDRYGREIGKVFVDGFDVNLEQIKRGLAWHYKTYQREQHVDDRQSYASAEQVASDGHFGLWQDTTPVAPWVFRHPVKTAP